MANNLRWEKGFDYEPLTHQIPFWNAMMTEGKKRAVLIWHRRAGKDLTAWCHMIVRALQTPGNYFYFFPTAALGKKILWNGKTRDGKPFIDYIPEGALLKKHDTDLRLHLQADGGESTVQVIGTEDIDKSAVGTSCHGAIFSEYSIQDPRGWQYVSPIIRETGGWATFVYTPRGHNHGYTLYANTRDRDNWFVSYLSIKETGLFTDEELDDDRAAGIDESTIQQEWYVSFEANVKGAYFAGALAQARKDGRIGQVPYDPALPVHTFWDIGTGDPTGIWFIQKDPSGLFRCIEYFERADEGLPYFARQLQERLYFYGVHVAPHDVKVREWGPGRSRLDTAWDLGLDFEPGDKVSKADQIEAGRSIIGRCVFDAQNCKFGLEALASYHAKYDEQTGSMSPNPEHGWESHCADAFMLFGTHSDYMDNNRYETAPQARESYMNFNPYTNEVI
mgnify:CR=1 FL=1